MKQKVKFTPKPGWVYVVTNDCLKPVKVKAGEFMGQEFPAVKIGNAKEFIDRLGSLNTAVYENFRLHMAIKMGDAVALEQLIHTALKDYQIKTREGDLTEFFACPLKEVISRIKALLVKGHMATYEEFKGGTIVGRSSSKIRSNLKKQEKVKTKKKGKAVCACASSGVVWKNKTQLARLIVQRAGKPGSFGHMQLMFADKTCKTRRPCPKTSEWRKPLEDAGLKFDKDDFVIDWRCARNPL